MIARLRSLTLFAVTAGVLISASVLRSADAIPALTQPVNDFARVLDSENVARMEALSRRLEAATGDAVVVATVPTIEPYPDIRAYAVEMFENQGKGIGDRGRDNGVLILLAAKQRSVWIEAGYGLEQWITDGFAGETSRELMAPEFRQGRYGAGLLAGMSRVVGRIAEGRNVTLTGVETPARRRVPSDDGALPLPVILLIFLAIVLLSRHAGGPGRTMRGWDRGGWSGWSSGVGPFGGRGWSSGGGFGGFGGFGGGRSGGGGGGASW
jgi:uncharacterized protein